MFQKKAAVAVPTFFILTIGLLFGFQNCAQDGFVAVQSGFSTLASIPSDIGSAVGNLGHRLTSPRGHIQYMGYYGSAMNGLTDMTQVTSDHANLTWLAYYSDSNQIGKKLQAAKALDMKAVVDLQLTFFDSKGHLYSDYQSRWQTLVPMFRENIDTVAAFYPMDEPYGTAKNNGISNGQRLSDLNKVNALIKSTFPSIPLAVTFEIDTLKNGYPTPNNYDWISFDCYGDWNKCGGKGVPWFFSKLKQRLSAGQRTFIVPWAFSSPKNYQTSEGNLISQAAQYYQLAQDPTVIAFVPFIYQQFVGTDGIPMNGVQSMPKLRQTLWTYGQQILGLSDGANPPSYNVTGYVDGLTNDAINGWACAQGDTDSISVDLYLNGPAGSGQGIGRYTANLSSERNVASACQVGSGSFRFSIKLSKDVLAKYANARIYIYGISPILGANNALGNGQGSLRLPAAASSGSGSSGGVIASPTPTTLPGHSQVTETNSATPIYFCGKQNVSPSYCRVHYYCGSRQVSSVLTNVNGSYVDYNNTAYPVGSTLNTFTIEGYQMLRAYYNFRCTQGGWVGSDPNNPNNWCEVNKQLDSSDPRCGGAPAASSSSSSSSSSGKKGGGGGGGCFVAGTQIQMADGSFKAIEKIQVGDQVMGYDEETKQPIAQAVTQLHHHGVNDQALHEFHMADGSVFTPNDIHPIFVVEQNSYFRTAEIKEMLDQGIRISLQRADGVAVPVNSIEVKKAFVPVYNFEVEGRKNISAEYGAFGVGHNYYAGGFLVHNAIYGKALGKVVELGILGVPSFALIMVK